MDILFYRRSEGKSPIEDFFEKLHPKTLAKVIWVLELIESSGQVPKSFFKKLKGSVDLWEVRVDHLNLVIRIICYKPKPSQIVLLHAFVKKTNKIPRKEMLIAHIRKRDHQSKEL